MDRLSPPRVDAELTRAGAIGGAFKAALADSGAGEATQAVGALLVPQRARIGPLALVNIYDGTSESTRNM